MRRGSRSLVRFTDEELALFGADHPVVDAPYLSALDEDQRRIALQVAYRSLCSHGAVAVDGGTGMELPEEVVTMLQVRASAKSALLISKATADLGVLRYHHLGTETVVIEDVSDAGTHDFGLIRPDRLADEIDAFCTVDRAADGQGGPATVTLAAFRAGDLAGHLCGEGVAQLDATVWHAAAADRRDQVLLGFLLGTGGSWFSRRVALPREDPEELLSLHPTEVDAVGDLIMREFLEDGDGSRRSAWHLMNA